MDAQHDILRFVLDWTVPLTNNEAERRIRFIKLKQKVSGWFQMGDGAKDIMKVMRSISSCGNMEWIILKPSGIALTGKELKLMEHWG